MKRTKFRFGDGFGYSNQTLQSANDLTE